VTRILFVGDIVGRPGRDLLERGLAAIVRAHEIHCVIVNVENAAAGFGVTPEIANEILDLGVHVMTGGNHTFDKKEIIPYFAQESRLLRPANLPAGAPGGGHYIARAANGVNVGVINVMGRVFMTPLDDPFKAVVAEIDKVKKDAAIVFVDFHAEATSEKIAMGWHLDGKATAMVGTHTHVQTADERVLPQGTAYITDAGMTGPHDGVIGVDRHAIVAKFLSAMPQRFETARENPRLNGVIVDADEKTGKAISIKRLSLSAKDVDALVAG
jgi:metallophosphoesterase (TIGR00282 family)